MDIGLSGLNPKSLEERIKRSSGQGVETEVDTDTELCFMWQFEG